MIAFCIDSICNSCYNKRLQSIWSSACEAKPLVQSILHPIFGSALCTHRISCEAPPYSIPSPFYSLSSLSHVLHITVAVTLIYCF